MIRNQKGFFSLLTVMLLPFVLALFASVYVLAGIVQINTHVNSDCRRQQIAAQAEVRKLLEKILEQNPKAKLLRTALTAAEAELALVSVSEPQAIPIVLQKIEKIKTKRATLDAFQKSLLTAANLLLLEKSAEVSARAQKNTQDFSRSSSSLFIFRPLVSPSRRPTLPIEPEYADVAPPYRTLPDFSQRVSMDQKWQYRLSVAKVFQPFLKGEATFQKLCSTTLAPEGNTWRIETAEDKSLSRP